MEIENINGENKFIITYDNDYEKKQIGDRLKRMMPIVNKCKNNPKIKGCGRKYQDKRGENTCGQKDWWTIDLCPECQAKHDANVSDSKHKQNCSCFNCSLDPNAVKAREELDANVELDEVRNGK